LGNSIPASLCDSYYPKILEQVAEPANCKPGILRLIAVVFAELQGKAKSACLDLISPLVFRDRSISSVGVENVESERRVVNPDGFIGVDCIGSPAVF